MLTGVPEAARLPGVSVEFSLTSIGLVFILATAAVRG
jgi:hypothetical protein